MNKLERFDAQARHGNTKPAYIPHDHLKPGRPAHNDEGQARLHAEIDRRYADNKDERRKRDNPFRHVALLRMNDIEKMCRASDDPADDWEHLTAAANHIAFIYRKPVAKIAAIVKWSRRFTPSIPIDGARLLAERIVAKPHMPTADKLGWRLGLTMEKRTELGITTIGAIDMTKAERLALRKKKDAEAARQRRAAQSSGKPRGRPSKGKPWEALGISKTTFYDRRTKMRRQHNASLYAADGISSGLRPQPAAAIPTPSDAGGSPIPQRGSLPVSHPAPSSLPKKRALHGGDLCSVPSSSLALASLRVVFPVMRMPPRRAIAFMASEMVTEVRP
jgi:hypothetical protein